LTAGFSTWQGRIRKDPSWPTDYSPIGPVTGRDYAVNNAMHYADVFGQVRVQMSLAAGAYVTSLNTASTTWAPTWVGPTFPVQLRPDGSSYRLRVRIAGAGESAGFKVRFAVSVGSPDALFPLYPGSSTSDAVWSTGDISSTTVAYRAGASLGSNAWPTMAAMSALEVAPCSRSTPTITDVAGDPISVTQAIVQAIVWTSVEDVAHPARLYAFSLEEWPG
jgi:hypothetical protein